MNSSITNNTYALLFNNTMYSLVLNIYPLVVIVTLAVRLILNMQAGPRLGYDD